MGGFFKESKLFKISLGDSTALAVGIRLFFDYVIPMGNTADYQFIVFR